MILVKRFVSCLTFVALTVTLIGRANDVLVDKVNNRYYILEDFIASSDQEYDVQVYGSCHAYTSFDPSVLAELTGLSSYVFANPGEIIPATYLRMRERFKTDVPQVAVVDIWGLNAYDTYSSTDSIFNSYLPLNIERIPLSLAKIEVIRDYASLDMLADNFAIAKYKDRLLNLDLNAADFNYSFSSVVAYSADYVENEMTLRQNNNGFAAYNAADYTQVLADYDQKQAKVAAEDTLAYEEDIVKYTQKIIDLCAEYGVELIFYRAPYISNANELRKSNWLKLYCAQQEVLYLDLEELVDFDTSTDFLDYEHLNVVGARRATAYLAEYIAAAGE